MPGRSIGENAPQWIVPGSLLYAQRMSREQYTSREEQARLRQAHPEEHHEYRLQEHGKPGEVPPQ